jgi:hypothetical protein
MKGRVLSHPEVEAVLREFVFAELYTDDGAAKEENARLMRERFGSVALPLYLVLSPEGKELARLELETGLASRAEFIAFLRQGQARLSAQGNGAATK